MADSLTKPTKSELIFQELSYLSQYFGRGNFTECIKRLSAIHTDGISLTSLATEQNVAVCKASPAVLRSSAAGEGGTISRQILSKSIKMEQGGMRTSAGGYTQPSTGTKPKEINQAMESLYNIIHKVHGLPMTESHLVIECVAVYNLYYLQNVNSSSTQKRNTAPDQRTVYRCLYRAHQYQRQDGETIREGNIDYLAADLLKARLSDELKGAIVQLLLIYYMLRLLSDDDDSRYVEVLYRINETVKHIKLPSYLFSLPLLDGKMNGPASLESVSVILLCSKLYKDCQYLQCEKLIEETKGKDSSPENRYLRGCVLYRLKKYTECLSELYKLCDDNVRPRLRAMAKTCIGSCFSHLGAVHNAVQHYKDALDEDFSYTNALYCIADKYRQMSLHDAELESLRMLITIKDDMHPENEGHRLDINHLLSVIPVLDPFQNKSRAEIMLHLARRYSQLKRFGEASMQYLDLLSHLTSDIPYRDKSRGSLPMLATIFLETARALISSGRHEDSVVVCDQVLAKYCHRGTESSPMNSQELSQAEEPSGHSSQGRRKRIHSEDKDSIEMRSDLVDELGLDALASKYQAEALYKLGSLDGALDSINSVVALLEKRKLSLPPQVKAPEKKRARLGSEAEDEERDDEALSFVMGAYILKAVILGNLKKFKSALTSIHCCLQLNPDDSTSCFLRCLLLLKIGEVKEASYSWLKFRNLHPRRMDRFHLQKLLDSKYQRFKNKDACPPELSQTKPTEEHMEILDVICLRKSEESLLNRKK